MVLLLDITVSHQLVQSREIVMGKVHRMTSAIDTKVGLPIYCTTSRHRGYLIVSTSAATIFIVRTTFREALWEYMERRPARAAAAAAKIFLYVVYRTYLRKNEK